MNESVTFSLFFSKRKNKLHDKGLEPHFKGAYFHITSKVYLGAVHTLTNWGAIIKVSKKCSWQPFYNLNKKTLARKKKFIFDFMLALISLTAWASPARSLISFTCSQGEHLPLPKNLFQHLFY